MKKIKIGKNAIENLTSGMYEDSKIIYREYIQNAADAIDIGLKKGLFQEEDPSIDITIDSITRTIRIKDNAQGIKRDEIAEKLANVADSDKVRGINKGFRGIGRLGGLAYCQTLRFITTYLGEAVQTTMVWDANKLIRILNDETNKHSASEVLESIIRYEEEPCDPEDHFFIVEIENVRPENNELLDIEEVKKYISANAPVAYSNKFHFRSLIAKYVQDNNLQLSEYRVFVEGDDIFKDYNTVLYDAVGTQKRKYDEIYGIEFKEFYNSNDELLAWMWFGVSTFEKQIPVQFNDMRGIRLRKENIGIGNSSTLNKFFKESRGNYYFIGELHAVHKGLIPNARRDYFNENKTRLEFEEEIKYYLREKLHNLYQDSNKAKNAFRREVQLVEKRTKLVEKENFGFINKDERTKLQTEIDEAEKENLYAKRELERLNKKSQEDQVFAKVMNLIEKKHIGVMETKVPFKEIEKKENKNNKDQKPPLVSDRLYKLNREQRKLISKVYKVINDMLPPDQSESLIKRIEEELNKNEQKSTTN